MKTLESLGERELETKVPEEVPELGSADLGALEGLEPRRALTLSIIPGLGQIYNGETVKGYLFIGVTVANLILLSLLFSTETLLNFIIHCGALFHTESKLNIEQALAVVHSGRTVTMVYLGLILSFSAYVARDAYDRAREKRFGKLVPRFKFSMPEATSGSYLFHFSLICTLVLAVIFFVVPSKPKVQVTEIALVAPDKPEPPKKAPDPPKPKQEPKQELKEEPKKVEPPKQAPKPPQPTPVAFAVKTDKAADPVVVSSDPAPAAAAPTPTTGDTSGSATGGSPGGSAGGGEGDDFDFGAYLAEVQKRIKKTWHPPRGAESQSVTLKFKVLADGTATNIRLVKSSGVSASDDAAKEAIANGSPFPPLPKSAGDDIDIKFTFDYNVFSGRAQ